MNERADGKTFLQLEGVLLHMNHIIVVGFHIHI